ncbi:GRAM domain-containing protein [Dyadobacter sp. CY312]|uniref:GRAM domain-containing protein n=1 Tax=Dyadobacter sp. CY312 TaxID=2907303 RepID=UPI001F20AAA9|nr:GRAM domain-containing protein [Dyadobacter sp. CY312]MCE7040784.1 GRAM domain-containing protein [Dyadobacter sp. CY312]
MKRFNIREALYFGTTMTLFKIVEKIWAGDLFSANFVGHVVIYGLINGILFGFLFGTFVRYFQFPKFVGASTKIDTEPDENILFQTGANHFKVLEAVGGKLFLTNKRLVFKSHKLNIQNHELSIDLTDIKKVERTKTAGLIDNGLTVTSGDNKIDKFVVERAEEWVEKMS